eukprot:2179163-Pleurochrysis_carterae.AAC.1
MKLKERSVYSISPRGSPFRYSVHLHEGSTYGLQGAHSGVDFCTATKRHALFNLRSGMCCNRVSFSRSKSAAA